MNREEQKSTALSTEVCVPRRRRVLFGQALAEGLERRRERNGEIVLDLIFGGLCCLFAMRHAAFGVYPFSLALIFAASRRTLPLLLGAAVGCTFLGDAGVLYLALHILAFLYRLWASYPKERRHFPQSPAFFEEEPALRAMGALILGVGMALYELILFGVHNYTVLFAAGAVFLLPLCTLSFSFFTAQGRTLRALIGKEAPTVSPYFGTHAPHLLSLGGVSLLFVTAFALSPYYFFGISLSSCAVVAFTLFTARRYGAAKGCVVGLLTALSGEVLYLPAYGLLGLLSGLYGGIGMPLSLAAAVLAGGGYAAYAGGLSGFLAVVPEMTVTSLLLWVPLSRLSREEGQRFFTEVPPNKEEETPEEKSLACLSGALSAVSEELRAAATREKTLTPEEYEDICVHAKEKICRRCPADGGCNESDDVWQTLRSAILRLSLGEGVPCGTSSPCEGYGKMLEEIRRETARLGHKKRQGGAKGALSTDYALLAEMLKEVTRARAAERERNVEAETALAEALAGYGIVADGITVLGERHKRIRLTALCGKDGKSVEGEWVEDACVRVCGKSVTGLRFSYEEGKLCAHTESRRLFCSEGGLYTAAGGEDECAADAAATFENENGLVYALLSDGMGRGVRAAQTASLAVSILSSLLSAGVGRQVALALLNNVICSSEEECSVAFDLLSLDLYEGRAGFLKSGAAASFVYRDGALFRIRSRTIPLGLLRIVDSEEASFEVRAGDILVLLSDGVLGESEDGGWLKDILARRAESAWLAKAVVEEAVARCASKDDKTALVLRIFATKEK
ncbi:MAG: hypothetical protein E7609_03335 [Ruminococcaceae bacterium]|nr:hypothetical protein [Oscillospiraceae bacterium]